jgi:hypothetical protein
MKKKTTDAVIEGADDAFCFAVLGRGIGTGEPEMNTMSGKMVVKS